MFASKFLNIACVSLFSLIFGIAISSSLVSAQEEGAVEQVVLNIHGMTSAEDAEAVKAALLKCNGVKDATVSHQEATAVVTANEADYDELAEAVESAGFSVVEEE